MNLRKLSNPLKFSQEIGSFSLKYQDTFCLRLGKPTLDFKDILYLSDYSLSNMSAAQFKKKHKILA